MDKQKRSNSRIFFVILMFLVSCLLIGQVARLAFKNDDMTDVLRTGNIIDSFNVEGYLIRDEVVMTSGEQGYLAPSVPSGEKVGAFEVVAQAYDESSQQLLNQAQEAERLLTEEIRKTVLPASYKTFDIRKVNQVIEERLVSLMAIDTNADFERALGFERDIRNLTEEKVEIVLKSIPENTNLKLLQQQANNLKEQFKSSSGAIKAVCSGIVSYNVDGYEKKLSLKNVNSIDPSVIEGIQNEKNKNEQRQMDSMKIIKGFNACIASIVDNSFAESLIVNEFNHIRLNDISLELDGRLIRKVPYKNGKTMVIYRVDRGIEETSGLRKINIDIMKGTDNRNGLRISRKSLLNADYENGNAEVVVVRAHEAIIRKVTILDYDEVFAIIVDKETTSSKAVALFDEYLINPKGIKERQLIH